MRCCRKGSGVMLGDTAVRDTPWACTCSHPKSSRSATSTSARAGISAAAARTRSSWASPSPASAAGGRWAPAQSPWACKLGGSPAAGRCAVACSWDALPRGLARRRCCARCRARGKGWPPPLRLARARSQAARAHWREPPPWHPLRSCRASGRWRQSSLLPRPLAERCRCAQPAALPERAARPPVAPRLHRHTLLREMRAVSRAAC